MKTAQMPEATLLSCSLDDLLNSKFLDKTKEVNGKQGNLRIPPYQRDYSWTETQIRDLFNDTYNLEEDYLMGTFIIHSYEVIKEKHSEVYFDIVDGQQRLVTLSIFLHCINPQSESPLLDFPFSVSSYSAIKAAQDLISHIVSDKDVDTIKLEKVLLNLLKFNVLILSGDGALDLAYTFFDSVNSKGRALTDFDLLKAHHLMYIPSKLESIARVHNDKWQARDENHHQVFTLILRRLRMWSRGLDRDNWAPRPDFEEFKSVVEPEEFGSGEHKLNRYMQPYAFSSWKRINNKVVLSMNMPMEVGESLVPTYITQTIEGGDAFFLFAERYHNLYEFIFSEDARKDVSSEIRFLRQLSEYITNQYLSNSFKAIMLLYIDKFGEDRIVDVSVCVERVLSERRWIADRLTIESVLSHVRKYRLVPIILESLNDRHAFAQLLEKAQLSKGSDSKDPLTRSANDYHFWLSEFYKSRLPKVQDERIISLIKNEYSKGWEK